MGAALNNWGPAALIVFGYIVAAFWQNKRIDDLRDVMNEKFERVYDRLKGIEDRLDRLDARVKALEDARTSGIVGVR